MDKTLTSIEHAASYLPDRTTADAVADKMHQCLRTATALIGTYLRADFSDEPQTFYFTTEDTYTPTPGASPPPFSQPRPYMSLDIPVSGPVDSLEIRYRGDATMDEDFSWDDVEPLVAGLDYLFDTDANRVNFLFPTAAMPIGLQIVVDAGYGSSPEILMGDRRVDLYSRMGLDTALEPLVAMFTGVEHKMREDSARTSGVAPGLAEIVVVPPEPIGLHSVTLYTARDAALVSTPQEVTLTLYGGPVGAETVLSTRTIQTPLPGQRYSLAGQPGTAYDRYRATITGTANGEVVLSTVALQFADAERAHMRGFAPGALSDACALLAWTLYSRAGNDGVGKSSDYTNRSYTGSLIPAEVKALLSPFRKSHVAFV